MKANSVKFLFMVMIALAPFASQADEATADSAPGPFASYYQKASGYLYGFSQRYMSTAMAKEVCSCHFITGLEPKYCETQFPHIPNFFWNFVKVKVDDEKGTVTVVPRLGFVGFTVLEKTATFSEEPDFYGCHVD